MVMKEDKGKFEEIIHDKLYDYEVKTNKDDWTKICSGLPDGKKVIFRPWQRFAAAAAVVALLIVGGSIYFITNDSRPDNNLSKITTINKETAVFHAVNEEKPESKITVNKDIATQNIVTKNETPTEKLQPAKIIETDKTKLPESPKIEIKKIHSLKVVNKDFIADASTAKKQQRRWGIGMGGGSIGMSSNSSSLVFSPGPTDHASAPNDYHPVGSITNGNIGYLDKSMFLSERNYNYGYDIPSGEKVEHKLPLSVGLGVSYYLSDRWTLQSGLVYTLLKSEWSNNYAIFESSKINQTLHFVGIPMNVTYKIAQINRLRVYATAGGLVELNVSGSLKRTTYLPNSNFSNRESLRMKEPLFSVNSRAGIAYPVWRFINIYAEGGVSYYFDNKSFIRTVRSDKPFNVSLQAGISFGF
jgi:hypothetical protein